MENNKKLAEIDYSCLVTLDSYNRRKLITVIFAMAVPFVFLLIGQVLFFNSGVASDTAGPIYYFTFIAVFSVVYLMLRNVEIVRSKEWKNFAKKNAWEIAKISVDDAYFIPPGMYGVGHGCKVSSVISAVYEGHVCDVFIYQYAIGSGRDRRTYYYTIARVRLEKAFPHLILDSKYSWSITKRGDATEPVKLEGNFANDFTLYYRPGENIDALSIITPDVMQAVQQKSKYQDIEVIDKSIFFILTSDRRNANDVKLLLESVDVVVDEIKHKQTTLNYIPEVSEEDRISAMVKSNSSLGRKVSRSLGSIILYAIYGIVFIMIIIGLFTE